MFCCIYRKHATIKSVPSLVETCVLQRLLSHLLRPLKQVSRSMLFVYSTVYIFSFSRIDSVFLFIVVVTCNIFPFPIVLIHAETFLIYIYILKWSFLFVIQCTFLQDGSEKGGGLTIECVVLRGNSCSTFHPLQFWRLTKY